MRNTLILQPIHSSTSDILRCFVLAKPLSSEQRNFLARHQKLLSSPEFDTVLKYYLQADKKNELNATSLVPKETFTPVSIQLLKHRLQTLLANKACRAVVQFTPQQLANLQELSMPELIYWHGNQTLNGAPFFPGGTPPVLYFQWGNLFGIIKHLVLSEEKSLLANTLVYFEDLQDRDLNQCVLDYEQKLRHELEKQNQILFENKIEPASLSQFLIKTPTLTLDPMKHLFGDSK